MPISYLKNEKDGYLKASIWIEQVILVEYSGFDILLNICKLINVLGVHYNRFEIIINDDF